jgi:Gnt-I system high-affinity gluconate transporter
MTALLPGIVVFTGVVLLFVLITAFRINAFISFILVCLYVGLIMGLPISQIVNALQKGIGDTLGFLLPILGFGAMLGKIVAQSGAAKQITQSLISLFGIKKVQFALILAGFIVGIPMFYNVGFVILVPIVFAVASSAGLPLLYIAVPMLAALSITHGLLPPHPAPVAIAGMFHADIGKIMLYGTLVSIPAIIAGGPLLSPLYRKFRATPLEEFVGKNNEEEENLPSAFISIIASLMPVILIGAAGICSAFLKSDGVVNKIFQGIGNPVIAMLLSVLFAVYMLEVRRGKKISGIMENLAQSIAGIAMILLILAGAGALKEVLVATGVSDSIGKMLMNSGIPPLILGWLIAAVIRIATGSATVAGMTSAGIVLPLVNSQLVSPELMILSIGAGSLILSHVNDGGFWLFKEYFGLSVKETLCTWTVMETVISLVGLGGVLILNIFL